MFIGVYALYMYVNYILYNILFKVSKRLSVSHELIHAL